VEKIRLGFLTVHGDTENHSQMMGGVFEAAEKYDVSVIRFATRVFAENYDRYNAELDNLQKIVKEQQLDGLMYLGWMPGLAGKYFPAFLERFNYLPIVSLGTKYDDIPNVYADPEKCITDLMEHMIHTHGCSRIVFVPPSIPDIRNEVYMRIINKYGLYHEELLISNNDLRDLPFEDRMLRVLAILLDERQVKFDAVLVMFDTDAQNLLKQLKIRGIRVPGDFAIASYEDTEFANYSLPPLTTITYPWREVGYYGCEKLIKILHHETIENSTGIISKLIIRNSCGCRFNNVKLSKIDVVQPDRHATGTKDFSQILDFSQSIRQMFPYTSLQIEQLLRALVSDFALGTTTAFFNTFEEQLEADMLLHPSIDMMDETEELVYFLRNRIVAFLSNDSRSILLFESILLKTLLIIKEKSISIIGYGNIEMKGINQQLHYVSQSLISTFNLKPLLRVLENNLSNLQIRSCYIFLAKHGNLDDCSLIFKYDNGIRSMEQKSRVRLGYISEEISGKHKRLLCQLLYVQDECLGVIVFEPQLIDIRIYQTLSLHISSALKSALLMENLTHEITLRKEKENQLQFIANHDALTGLHNRRYFNSTLEYLLENGKEKASVKAPFYLVFIDFDDIKIINDTYGHDAGDELLIEIALRLKTTLSGFSYRLPNDADGFEEKSEAIFRLGGDEFTAIVSGISLYEMEQLAAEMIDTVKAPYQVEGKKIHITCSIGISSYPDDANSAVEIVTCADTAMYRAKTKKSMFCFYNEKD